MLIAASLILSTAHAAPIDWQAVARDEGLAAAAGQLGAAPPSAERAFALGAVRVLHAFEVILQTRYRHYAGRVPFAPGMGNAIPANPQARFDPAFLEQAMAGALAELAAAERALELATRDAFAVVVDLDDLWLDIDGSSARSPFEALPAVFAGVARERGTFDGEVRFDSADADWLKACVHASSALAELVLAVDPTPAIRRVFDGRRALAERGALSDTLDEPEAMIETLAATLLALRGTPEAARTRAAHGHLKAAIQHNRAFWRKVEQEQDDDREWLPNARQSSAFGVSVPATLAGRWEEVLDEFEAILDGEALLPHWRLAAEAGDEGVGVNLRRLLLEPGDMDLVLWIQGTAAVPYLERGPIADRGAWRRFSALAGQDALLFALWLN